MVFMAFVMIGILAVGMICAIVNWIAVALDYRKLTYVFKPLTLIIFMVGAFLLSQGQVDRRLATWFQVALFFSLAGDVLLMLPGDRWFMPGLLAFLIAHLCYIVGLNPVLPPWGAVIFVVVAALVDGVVLSYIVKGVMRSGEPGLRLPVIVYSVILSLTLVSGWATWFRPGWAVAGRIAVSLAGTLFYASDLMLAWDRFVAKSQVLRTLVMVTYHLAQLGFVLTIALK